MPIYDFQCEACGKIMDRMLSMDRRNDLQICPDCGGRALRKEISSFGTYGWSEISTCESCGGG